MAKTPDSRDGWRSMVLVGVVLAGVIFGYPLLLGIPLLDPDEGLHASIAQEMVERGDWVTPRFLGKPFLDKPIFYFWAEALSLRMFGMNEAAVRFPGLLFGLLGAVTTGIVGRRMFGAATGLVAGLFYATLIVPAALAQAATHDVALVPCVGIALLLFWQSDRAATPAAAIAYTVAIGLLLGLTCLTKGLAGVALVGVAYGCYLLVTRRLTPAAGFRGAAALAIAALAASTWYIAVELRNPGYLHYYFVERHLLGYTTGTQTHGDSPWWYYLPILLGGGLPWIAYLPVTVQDQWARWISRDQGSGARDQGSGIRGQGSGARYWGFPLSAFRLPPSPRLRLDRPEPGYSEPGYLEPGNGHGAMVLLWCWLVGCTLFLSLSHSKLVTYIWPVFPAVAILAAVAWVRLIEGTLAEPARRTILATFWMTCLSGAALLPVAIAVAQSKFSVHFAWPVWTAAVLVAVGSWGALGFLYVGRLRATLSFGMLSLAAQYAVIMAVVLPHVAAATTARDLALHFNRLGRIPPRLLVMEDRLGSLVFYLNRDLRAALQEGQLEEVLLEDADRLPKPEPGTLVALPERRLERAARYFDLAGLDYQSIGRYRLYKARELGPRLLAATTGSRTARR